MQLCRRHLNISTIGIIRFNIDFKIITAYKYKLNLQRKTDPQFFLSFERDPLD